MSTTPALTVFCGSSPGTAPAYTHAAKQVGHALATRGITLVYGGGTSGLMGTVAASTLSSGGRVHGVLPTAFASAEGVGPDAPKPSHLAGEADRNLQTSVGSMHVRKKLMSDLSQGFIGLPGGYGTLEEVAEMATWTQLGIHKKPVILLNVLGFFSPLRAFVEGGITAGFISPKNRAFLVFVDAPSTGEEGFDWGTAALAAVDEWETAGMGGGTALSLEWPDSKKGELR